MVNIWLSFIYFTRLELGEFYENKEDLTEDLRISVKGKTVTPFTTCH